MNPSDKAFARNNDDTLLDPSLSPTDTGSTLNQRFPFTDEPVHTDNVRAIQEKPRPTGYDAPPNGGLVAWLQVAGSFFLFFNSWYVLDLKCFYTQVATLVVTGFLRRGTINTFGVFQTYYETAFLSDQSPSNISWIGSMQAFLLLIIGVMTGPLYDAGYFRALVLTGSFLVVFGLMMTSLCSKYWQVMLAQAICIGLGNGCLYIPSVAILPQYFTTKKALATGLAASGSSLGGVIYPIVFRQLQPRIGFGWGTRVLGFISLATCLFSVSVMRVRQMPKQKRSLLEPAAFTEAPYSLFCTAMFSGYVGFFGPIFYIQPYAIQTKAMSEDVAFYLLPILNAASVPGRIIPGFLAGTVGPINMLLPAATTTGILALCWIAIHNTPGLIVFSVLYGFFSGGFVSLPAVALTSLTPDLRTLGTRMGMCSVICGLGSLCGAPISGAILSATGKYVGVQLFSGITICFTGLLLLLTRVSKAGARLKVKV
jgi:MFS family permease